MKYYLVLDVETTGLAAVDRVIQIAALLANEDGENQAEMSMVIKPETFNIPDESITYHGITNEYAQNAGLPAVMVLKFFHTMVTFADVLVGHNLEFDSRMILNEYEIYKMEKEAKLYIARPKFCTMKTKAIIDYCGIPKKGGGKGFKWPKLEELYEHVIGQPLEGAHSAHSDVMSTARCFFMLKDRDIITTV